MDLILLEINHTLDFLYFIYEVFISSFTLFILPLNLNHKTINLKSELGMLWFNF